MHNFLEEFGQKTELDWLARSWCLWGRFFTSQLGRKLSQGGLAPTVAYLVDSPYPS